MATYLTDRPFSGIKQAKYEALLETDPEWVKKVSREELEETLELAEDTFLDKTWTYLDARMKALGCGDGSPLQRTDPGRLIALREQAMREARELARQDVLAS